MLEKLQQFSALNPKPKVLTQSLREVHALPPYPFELFCPALSSLLRSPCPILYPYVSIRSKRPSNVTLKPSGASLSARFAAVLSLFFSIHPLLSLSTKVAQPSLVVDLMRP